MKTEHGDRYTIREISSADENRPAEALRKETSSSASATKEILALEAASETSYAVEFPTLDQVFLKVTDSTIDEQERDAGATAQESEREIEAATNGQPQSNISLDHSHAIGFFRQVAVLLRKKYILLRHNWLSFLMALAIPIVIAAVLAKYMPIFPTFDSCEKNYANMLAKSAKEAIEKSSYTPPYPIFGALNAPGYISSLQGYDISTVVGPISAFDDPGEDALYDFSVRKHFSSSYSYSYKNRSGISEEFSSRVNVSSLDALLSLYSNDSISAAFGIFIPENESASIVYTMGDSRSRTITALNIVTNHISNTSATASEPARKVDTTYRIFRTVDKETDFRLMPLTLLITLGLIASTSVAILYPVYERINNSRALQYCNGVSPAALWLSYLLFEMQIMLLVTILTWAIVFGSATASKIWFAPNYLFGAMILFGIATYLGLFVLSLIVKKMAYAIAAGLHLLFFGLTLLAYLLNDNAGDLKGSNSMALQAGFGLLSPVANLLRAFFIAIDSFDLTCGESGYLVQDPFKYHLYGGVYANFIIQIVFLSLLLTVVEYGSSDWIHRVFSARRGPPGLKSIIEDSEAGVKEKSANDSPSRVPTLVVSKVTKYFGKLFATQNISFNVSSNEKLALLGPNGAGKTTMINMIRGLIKPNYGEIHVEGVSVRKQPQKARVYMGGMYNSRAS